MPRPQSPRMACASDLSTVFWPLANGWGHWRQSSGSSTRARSPEQSDEKFGLLSVDPQEVQSLFFMSALGIRPNCAWRSFFYVFCSFVRSFEHSSSWSLFIWLRHSKNALHLLQRNSPACHFCLKNPNLRVQKQQGVERNKAIYYMRRINNVEGINRNKNPSEISNAKFDRVLLTQRVYSQYVQ